MAQGKAGWWIAGACAVVVLISIGYGLGRRANPDSSTLSTSLAPAGSPLPAIQIEPIQPQAELASISGPSSPSTPAESHSSFGTTTPTASASTGVPSSPSAAGFAPAPTLPMEGSARIREIQRALKTAGFDPGPLDGQLGAKTKTAVRDFQTANGLEPDGRVGPRTWNKLEPYLKSAAVSD